MIDAEARLHRMQAVLAVARELTSTTALQPLLQQIIRVASDLSDSEAASILLLDGRSGELRFRAATGSASERLSDIPVPVEGSVAGRVLTTGKPVVVADARQEPAHYREVERQTGVSTESLLAVPLQIKERCIGVLEVINKRSGAGYSPDDVDLLSVLAAQAAVAIENARLVTALQDAYQRLSQLDRLKSDFIAIASHELRTPLSLILGYASLLRDRVEEEDARQLEVVLRAAERLKSIIETMLNLRYLESGELQLHPTRFELRAEVEAVCELYREIAQRGGVAFELDLPAQDVTLNADRECIHLVLDNLVSNAVKFNRPGGQVQIRVADKGSQVELCVTDSGIGIPPTQLEQIFDRFYQVEDPVRRRFGGVGLGLSIVRDLVGLHGGRVWAESTPGQGSRFFVLLPASASRSARPDQEGGIVQP